MVFSWLYKDHELAAYTRGPQSVLWNVDGVWKVLYSLASAGLSIYLSVCIRFKIGYFGPLGYCMVARVSDQLCHSWLPGVWSNNFHSGLT